MAAAEERKIAPSLLDRLKLDKARIDAVAAGLEKIAALTDPVGEILAAWDRPNGLNISRVRVPLGVIGIIYESRPNVTADAGGLCLKSGNAAMPDLLKAGHHIGLDTIGQTLRNANLQLRSDPIVPKAEVGPWNQSSYESDTMRQPLEVGCSA